MILERGGSGGGVYQLYEAQAGKFQLHKAAQLFT